MDKIREEIFEVSRLIAAERTGSLTEGERALLDEWRAASAQNGELYARVSGNGDLRDDFAEIRDADSWRALEQMRLRIEREQRPRHRRRAVFVASIAVAVCLAVGLWTLWPGGEENGEWVPGGKYFPTLTMSDGNVVRLDATTRVMTADGVVVDLAGDRRMIYNANDEYVAGVEPEIHTITVPKGNTFDIVLNDGTHVWLNAGSRISFPARFGADERRVSIEGEVYFDVTKNPDAPFVVEARGQSVVVFGTEFNVNAYGDRVVTTLVNGSVSVSAEGAEVVLVPGEQSVLRDGRITKRSVNVGEYISWREGYFVLEGQSFQSVMDAIGRWYDADIVWRDPALYDMEFEGRLPRLASLKETLEILEMTREVKFTLKGNRIEVGR